MKLNLGCSDDHKAGYVNVDQAPPADQVVDLNQRWPWEDSSVDEIFAHDVFEHLWPTVGVRTVGRWSDVFSDMKEAASVRLPMSGKTWAMNEAHRVLKGGGLLDITVPAVMLSDGLVNVGAFTDPTHVSYWTAADLFYFSEQFNGSVAGDGGALELGERARLGEAYGITARFEFPEMRRVRREWVQVPHKDLMWKLVDYGIGSDRRSKLIGRLRAVK